MSGAAISIEAVNAMTAEEFGSFFAEVAEQSPWVAIEAAKARPFVNREAMIEAFVQAMAGASDSVRLDLLLAHPDLAGRAARAGDLADASRREQASAGLDRLDDAQFARFHELNGNYRERFGIPFIFAVKGATVEQILAAFESRIANSRDAELAAALDNVGKIFRFRIEARVAPGDSRQDS